VPMYPLPSQQQQQQQQFGPMFGGGGPSMFPLGAGPSPGPGGDAYDPHEARMELRAPPGRAPLLPRDADPSLVQGELPVIQDLTRREPADDLKAKVDGMPAPGPALAGGAGMAPAVRMGIPVGNGVDVEMGGMGGAPIPAPAPARGGFRGGSVRGRGGGGVGRPGTFSGDVQRFRPDRRNDKTLVVEKIPEDQLSLDAVNGWFKRFGTVTNVAVDARAAKALVSFAEHTHAHAAWKSEEAVFGNRFVKVFWHRPMDGHGQAGQRALAESVTVVAGLAGSGTPVDATKAAPAQSPTARKATAPGGPRSALAEKQQRLEQFIAEQKALMERLKTATADEKKEIFARLRELGREIEQTKGDGAAAASTSATTSASASSPTTASASKRQVSAAPVVERTQRDLLDKELDLHSATADGNDETTEALKAKLAQLKAEVCLPYSLYLSTTSDTLLQAASLGIDPDSAEPLAPYPARGRGAPYRPYRARGRGRGRGAFRGGAPPVNMRLDNRPRALLVRDVAPDAQQAVRDWFEATGQVERCETRGADLVVSFRSRAAAEQGLAKGAHIPLAGHKQISWFAGSAPVAAAASGASAGAANGKTGANAGVDRPSMGADAVVVDDHVDADRLGDGEEDVAPLGWGDAADDGMGML
jgi:RNA-binding protein 26